MIKYLMAVFIVVFNLGAFIGNAAAQGNDIWQKIGVKIAEEAGAEMQSDYANMVVLTNASYLKGKCCSPVRILDGLAAVTHTSLGQQNLLEVHSAATAPLWVAVYDQKTGKVMYCTVNQHKVKQLSDKLKNNSTDFKLADVLEKCTVERIDYKYLSVNPADFDKKMKAKVFDGNEFRILSIINAVDAKAPPELLKSALYHDHFCPGVTSGYLIAQYLQKEFPLTSGKESYTILSLPAWCKEDALQTILNTTPGKSGLLVLTLQKELLVKHLPKKAENLAGIYFKYDSQKKTGQGMVLLCDMSKLRDFTPAVDSQYGWLEKLATVRGTLDNLAMAEKSVQCLKKWSLKSGETPADYTALGNNILKHLDLWSD